LENNLSSHYNDDIHLFLKDRNEIKNILDNNPFETNAELHIYAFICENNFEQTLYKKFNAVVPAENEKAAINGGQFYWRVSKGMTLDAGFSKTLGDKKMREQFTSRNINTIQKIFEKMKEDF